MNRFKRLAAAAALSTIGMASAHASLVYLQEEGFSGSGLGNVQTVLTIQSPANSSTATGSVAPGSNGERVITGDALQGNSQSVVRSLGQAGVASASELRLVFNAVEPGGDGITLDNLVLTLFSPSGVQLFSSGAFAPVEFGDTNTGTGNSGFVFGLDADQAAQAQAAAFTNNFAANLIGLSASVSGATGGNETFFVARRPGSGGDDGGNPVPLPGTVALLALGAIGAGLATRRKG